MKGAGKTVLALAVAAAVAVVAVTAGSASPQQTTVVIGWAYDGVGNMAAPRSSPPASGCSSSTGRAG
jgi:hypothetical protein